MRVHAFMHSLQARLIAEGVPYEDLDLLRDLSGLLQVRFKIAKVRYICMNIDADPPIQLIRSIVFRAGLIALEVQDAR